MILLSAFNSLIKRHVSVFLLVMITSINDLANKCNDMPMALLLKSLFPKLYTKKKALKLVNLLRTVTDLIVG